MKKISTYLIIFLLTSCSTERAFDYYNEALELEGQGKFTQAIKLHNKAIKIIPNFTPSIINRGADKAELKDYKGAISDLRFVIRYDSSNTLALFNLGINYRRLVEYDSAFHFYNKALKTKGAIELNSYNNPEYPRNYEFVFDAFDESNYQVTKAEIYFEKGFAFYQKQEYLEAIINMEKASQKHSQKYDCYYFLGKSFVELDSIDKACSYFGKLDESLDEEIKELKEIYCNKNTAANSK